MMSRVFMLLVSITSVLLIAGPACASGSGQYYLGDEITLQGYSTSGGPYVYLFLTGPNLPANGVALDDLTARADEGHVTKVSVDSSGYWVYKWGTAYMTRGLDAGTYSVWVTDTPTDKSNLASTEYSMIPITLGTPGISVNIPSVPGSVNLSSVPPGAAVSLNGVYKGTTPLTVSGLDPGTYNAGFTLSGYVPFSTAVQVVAGGVTEVVATLGTGTGSLAVNATPAGASVTLDGTYAGIAPLTVTNLTPGNHTLSVSAAGYSPAERTIQISAGMVQPVEVVLAPSAAGTPAAVLPFSQMRAADSVPAPLLAAGLIAALAILCRGSRQ